MGDGALITDKSESETREEPKTTKQRARVEERGQSGKGPPGGKGSGVADGRGNWGGYLNFKTTKGWGGRRIADRQKDIESS